MNRVKLKDKSLQNFVPKNPGQERKLKDLRTLEEAGRGNSAMANQLRDELLRGSEPDDVKLIAMLHNRPMK